MYRVGIGTVEVLEFRLFTMTKGRPSRFIPESLYHLLFRNTLSIGD